MRSIRQSWIIIGIAAITFLFFYGLANAIELTPTQQAEKKEIRAFIDEVNKTIHPATVITDKTFNSTGDLIESLLKKRGYTGKEYKIMGYICKNGHAHYKLYIQMKTMKAYWIGGVIYKFTRAFSKHNET